jgi:hypothetical protein
LAIDSDNPAAAFAQFFAPLIYRSKVEHATSSKPAEEMGKFRGKLWHPTDLARELQSIV